MSQYMSQDVFVMKYDMLTSQIPAFFLRKKPSVDLRQGGRRPPRGVGGRGAAEAPAALLRIRFEAVPGMNGNADWLRDGYEVIVFIQYVQRGIVLSWKGNRARISLLSDALLVAVAPLGASFIVSHCAYSFSLSSRHHARVT